jgi:hypothetical protein
MHDTTLDFDPDILLPASTPTPVEAASELSTPAAPLPPAVALPNVAAGPSAPDTRPPVEPGQPPPLHPATVSTPHSAVVAPNRTPRRQAEPASPFVGRSAPHSQEAEEYLLSCILLDGADVLARCEEAGLTASSFYLAAHSIVYERLVDLKSRAIAIDVAVLAEDLKAVGQLDTVGGFAFITQISGYIPTTATADYHIEKVRELAETRSVLRVFSEAGERLAIGYEKASEVLPAVRIKLDAIDARNTQLGSKGFPIWTIDEFEKYNPPADDALMGEGDAQVYWRLRELMFIFGPGGVGKSRISLQIAISQILSRSFCKFRMLGPPRRWLLVGNENSARRYKDELSAMLRGFADVERKLVAEHLLILALVDDRADSLSLDDPQALKRWRETAAEFQPDILVVDPWEAVIPGGDCNDPVATREGIRLLRAIFSPHNQNFTPMIVHHAREGAEAARKAEGFDAGSYAKGSKTLRAMARFGINVAPEDPNDGARVVFACGKINDAKKFTTRGAVMDENTHLYHENPDFDLGSWISDVEGKRGNKSCTVRDVVEAVRAGNHKTGDIVETVRGGTGAGIRTIKSRLRDAVNGNYLASVPPQGNYTLGSKKL